MPIRVWGSGVPAPGASASAEAAERAAHAVLVEHLALLAPGAVSTDFALASNVIDGGDVRVVGYVQRTSGRPVVGGQVSFRFKRDRLFAIGSEALPNVNVAVPQTRLSPRVIRDRAATSLRAAVALGGAPVSALGDEVVLPLVADDAVLGYELVRPLTIDGGANGRYLAYAAIATGALVAIQQLNTYATGTLSFNSVDRYPGRGRIDRPASRVHVLADGAPLTTSPSGTVSWPNDAAVVLQPSAVGDLVSVANKAAGNVPARGLLAIAPGGQVRWDASSVETDDAQVNAYIATMIAKDFVRASIDAAMPTLDDQITVNVNIDAQCNAFFDGTTLNFFRSSDQCQNTALLQDVVFHEYAHRVHASEIITGVGSYDAAMAEGVSDFFAASITGDAAVGRGFRYTDAPLRDIDPDGKEWMWPADMGEIHQSGLIYAGALWDLRKSMIAQYGETAGIALANRLFLGTMRRAVDIPSSLIEALVTDDDDGNLANGTPNECAIRAAFGRHGLRTVAGSVLASGRVEVDALAIGVIIEVTGLSERCTSEGILGTMLDWVLPFPAVNNEGSAVASPVGPNRFFAALPLARQDSVSFKSRIQFQDGSSFMLADNPADPYYQLYQGRTIELYCTNFDTDPFAEGWTTGTYDTTSSPWQWGTPSTGATDPHAAFSGTHVLAQQLDGPYPPSERSFVKTPPIDVGSYSDVRVHYRRWLAVEDSEFDRAQITANDTGVWQNTSAAQGDSSSRHHIDREWRFHDVPVSGSFRGRTVTVGWELASDERLELGGWALDDVCVVANPFAICGDGIQTMTEQCDTGRNNAAAPDACRTDCRVPVCGDGIVDSTEQCDGNGACSASCIVTDVIGGCSSSGESGTSMLLVSWMLVFLRRRRTRHLRRGRLGLGKASANAQVAISLGSGA